MTNLNAMNTTSRTITALFDTRETADRASEKLVTLGVPRQHIQITEGSTD